MGFLSSRALLGPSPQGVWSQRGGVGPTALGNRGPCRVGEGVEIFGLGFSGVHRVVWYLHGSPQTEVTWALGKRSGFPGVDHVDCKLHPPHCPIQQNP